MEESQSFSSTLCVDEDARLLAHLVPESEGEAPMPTPEQFLSKRQRYQPVAVPQHVSEEDMARDWTLSDSDRAEIRKHRTSFRLFVAIQLCAVRLYGRFCAQVHARTWSSRGSLDPQEDGLCACLSSAITDSLRS